MTRSIALMAGLAAAAGAAGLTALARPGRVRRALGLPEAEATAYALRIAGMMLFALGLFLGGFAAAFTLAGGAA
ncbi:MULTISPECIES: hypothetical protein [Sphingomonas]|uniref:Uncharacterized protein n=1 Tax=Sphingomonas leidyi TaxID=68569 RepID=A0A7X5ZVH3_9SPHN|nr:MULTISPECIES: hypothetical protein [Sphingomonas]MBN8812915.1 hypothetical protein [Sphingomonas sp.]NIJ65111.1 hypothetical protein [Sphingomonas leidyi]OJY51167.1 MAG: hypothetical protein BGP17_22730 [Sphingomonas sp. 67-41]